MEILSYVPRKKKKSKVREKIKDVILSTRNEIILLDTNILIGSYSEKGLIETLKAQRFSKIPCSEIRTHKAYSSFILTSVREHEKIKSTDIVLNETKVVLKMLVDICKRRKVDWNFIVRDGMMRESHSPYQAGSQFK